MDFVIKELDSSIIKDLHQIEEYSIGHSIVARAVYVGFEQAVREMVDLVEYL